MRDQATGRATCQRCRHDLAPDEEACPECRFSPRRDCRRVGTVVLAVAVAGSPAAPLHPWVLLAVSIAWAIALCLLVLSLRTSPGANGRAPFFS
ncbi:hypothetical protein [Halalkalicoccus tibetensis]|uniref:Zinc-ribbon domain-containing protein n=1 Tax=Halalkalicoccus tibetensis TaxID=175632 RepID=A0ABD5V8D2_9EURY